MKYLSVTKARASFLRLVDNLDERTAIIRNGQPVAVLLDFDDYRGLVAAQALARDSERLTAIREVAHRFTEGHLEGFREVPDATSGTGTGGDPDPLVLSSDRIAAGRAAYARARAAAAISRARVATKTLKERVREKRGDDT